MSAGVQRVAVIGRDAAAWLVALGLRRALGGAGVEVEVVELPSALRPVHAFAALPSLAALHRLLGLDEAAVFAGCRAVPMLGQRFTGWNRELPAFVHAYDIQRPAIEDIDFLQFWIDARRQGMRVPIEDFSLAAAAAKQGRVGVEPPSPDSLGGFTPGYTLDAIRYTRLIRAGAVQAGVSVLDGTIAKVERDGDRITAVVVDSGRRVAADLFVDASGEGALIGGGPGDDFTSWRTWFGADRLLAASAPALKPLPAFSQVTAFAGGWVALHPLQDRTAVVAAYSSAEVSDAAMLAQLRTVANVPVAPDAVAVPFEAGARARPWIGNCVAVGASAARLEPLDAVELQVVQIGLTSLIALWPGEAAAMPEAAAYNAAVTDALVNARDFQIAHYLLSDRAGEPFWDHARAAPAPPRLAAKLSLFAARGQVPLYDDETFQSQNWSAVFLGHGLIPRDFDPLVEHVPVEQRMAAFQRLLGVVADDVRRMPTVDRYVAERSRPPAGRSR